MLGNFFNSTDIKSEKPGGVTFLIHVDSVSRFQVMANSIPRMGKSPLYMSLNAILMLFFYHK